MKKQHKRILFAVTAAFLVLFLASVYIASITDYMGVTVGMDSAQILHQVPFERLYSNYPFYFFRNDWGNPVVIQMSQASTTTKETVTKIRGCSSLWTSRSPHAFARIEKGMSVFEVTELVGIPLRSRTSGLSSSYYQDNAGNRYDIYWRNISGDYCVGSILKNETDMFSQDNEE